MVYIFRHSINDRPCIFTSNFQTFLSNVISSIVNRIKNGFGRIQTLFEGNNKIFEFWVLNVFVGRVYPSKCFLELHKIVQNELNEFLNFKT